MFQMNQQEDAEEFLSCILNKLHEEMVQILKLDRGKFCFISKLIKLKYKLFNWI